MRISRRSVLAAVPLMGCAGEASAQVNVIHVTPGGEGDGSSWQYAASLSAVADLIDNLEPGGNVLVAADRGEYALTEMIEIGHGGRASQEISIRGVNSATGEPKQALVRGAQAGSEGGEVFKLLRGASHIKFSHFDFRDVGNGAFRVAAPVSNITIEDCAFENVYRFFENSAGDNEGHASLDGFVLRRCRGSRVERGFLRIRYNSRNGLIEDCAAEGLPIQGGRIPVGCALEDRANNITYRRCLMTGFQQFRGADEYWNGDGFSDEPDNANIRYEACEARASTDGGFDCKSRGLVLADCIAEDNKRNFRIWGNHVTLTNCVSRNPNFRGREANENATSCHVWVDGEAGGDVEIINLTVEDRDATPIIEFGNDTGAVKIRGITINTPRVNWGSDEDRVRASMLVGEPQFHEVMAND
ncbi:MAG: hypothetical protein R3C31_07650 [Hyphomonadaceae bacterium]